MNDIVLQQVNSIISALRLTDDKVITIIRDAILNRPRFVDSLIKEKNEGLYKNKKNDRYIFAIHFLSSNINPLEYSEELAGYEIPEGELINIIALYENTVNGVVNLEVHDDTIKLRVSPITLIDDGADILTFRLVDDGNIVLNPKQLNVLQYRADCLNRVTSIYLHKNISRHMLFTKLNKEPEYVDYRNFREYVDNFVADCKHMYNYAIQHLDSGNYYILNAKHTLLAIDADGELVDYLGYKRMENRYENVLRRGYSS